MFTLPKLIRNEYIYSKTSHLFLFAASIESILYDCCTVPLNNLMSCLFIENVFTQNKKESPISENFRLPRTVAILKNMYFLQFLRQPIRNLRN